MSWLRDLARILRPMSNVKNVAIILFAYYLADSHASLSTIAVAALALSFICSAIYAFNSLNDVAVDRENRNKSRYAHAVERVGASTVRLLVALFFFGGLVLGATLGRPGFLLALLVLAGIAYGYSSARFRFKERVFYDVFLGGAMPHALRFIAGWFAFQVAMPPLLPVLGLAFAKSGGFVLYKQFDRTYLKNLGIRNTITMQSRIRNIAVSITFFVLALFAFGGMIVNSAYGVVWLGVLPTSFLFFLPLILPALPIMYAQILGLTRWDHGPLRLLGLVHWMILVLLFAWAFLL